MIYLKRELNNFRFAKIQLSHLKYDKKGLKTKPPIK